METTIILIAVLVLGAMALVVAEICTPTFGVLALAALGALVWAVCLAFMLNATFGIGLIVVLLIGMPVFIYYAVQILPKTPLGRHLALRKAQAPAGQGTPEGERLQQFVGRSAQAETILRPSGTIRIDDQRVVAQSESGLIQKGEWVTVLRACGTYVLVRKVGGPAAEPARTEGSGDDATGGAQ
ncbi:MAG: hypothetical protein BWX88_00045 [Planctomycetes bacterium ADurb.Bin126]|nr:MAG: hypothetical protein BWX88_00045 [Planctomycetes bacterium ADurb.Bin126]HQL74126.1 NfeD family protein [Phycisphaerae bacterium]